LSSQTTQLTALLRPHLVLKGHFEARREKGNEKEGEGKEKMSGRGRLCITFTCTSYAIMLKLCSKNNEIITFHISCANISFTRITVTHCICSKCSP